MTMATTPPLRTAVHTPPTPLHGARLDSYQPYSTRKSTRHSKQRSQRVNQTPPPPSSDFQSQIDLTSYSRDGSSRHQQAHTYSPPSSTQTSPQKKLFRARKSSELTKMNETNSLLDPLTFEPPQNAKGSSLLHLPITNTGANMLPTPAKTPSKKRVHSTAVASAARVLFPVRTETVEEAMPTPRKRGRKRHHVGFSLNGSFEDDTNSEDKIQIFTDSKDKVPEMDFSEDNPFCDHSAQPAPSQESQNAKGSKKKIGNTIVGSSKEIEEAFNHEEGMVYVFRGKKIFRKFADEHSPLQRPGFVAESSRQRPFTRSSVKPRLLFPNAAQRQERSLAAVEDEEAITDIEDLPPLPDDSEITDLAPETEEEALVTPVKVTFAEPTTPPTTGHATRAATRKAKLYSSAPEPVGRPASLSRVPEKKKLGSFNGWQRTKPTVSVARKGKKRSGEVLEKDGSGKKLQA